MEINRIAEITLVFSKPLSFNTIDPNLYEKTDPTRHWASRKWIIQLAQQRVGFGRSNSPLGELDEARLTPPMASWIYRSKSPLAELDEVCPTRQTASWIDRSNSPLGELDEVYSTSQMAGRTMLPDISPARPMASSVAGYQSKSPYGELCSRISSCRMAGCVAGYQVTPNIGPSRRMASCVAEYRSKSPYGELASWLAVQLVVW
ncbi:hypothetical protein F2Q68_00039831 [Brassica cretica]|uniref:Uncharacterized protein n=1 Tax=Brassica cretica TaxID=69181 RepID=A0A8S9MI11_BRACR|nr:hypothetical protein F2Q68_00039831 [Brassica cretica]